MRLVVLSSPASWYLADLRRAAGDRHEIVCLPFSRLISRLDGDCWSASSCATDLREADCVLVRTMPPGSLEQVVFRMDVLGRLEAAGTLVVNPPKALEAAVDKYLALAKLQAAGLPVPATIVCQNVDDAMEAFEILGRDVVLKPLFGSEGRGITRLTDEAVALRAFKALVQCQAVLYLQRFIPHHGHDLRLLVLGQRVLGMKRINPDDWRTNIARGATGQPFSPSEEMAAMARTAAAVIGAPLAGIDLLPGCDGRTHLLEVNAVPGWKALASVCEVDVAAIVLELIESTLARGGLGRWC